MRKTILFSPVGGTDPMSEKNYYDGSLIHICRHYKPNKIIAYVSDEMEKKGKNNHVKYCIEQLATKFGMKIEYEKIIREGFTEVQAYELCYNDFKGIIEKLIPSESGEDNEIILNVSSGTPAMKSALVAIKTLIDYNCKLIQVTTPEKGINTHIHTDNPDIELMWELNPNNTGEDDRNRCSEIHCHTLNTIKSEEILKGHIRNYDYGAAYAVAMGIPKSSSHYIKYIELAKSRLLLDMKAVDKLSKELNYDCIPIKSSDARKYYEYAISLEVKMKKGEYADFIRAITPLVASLFEKALKKIGIDIDKYTRVDKYGNRSWDNKALANSEILTILMKAFNGEFKYGNVYSSHLIEIIREKGGKNSELTNITDILREVEKEVRNIAAHEIVSVTDALIKEKTGYNANKIMEKIKTYFGFTNINIPVEAWTSYDDMNEYIIKIIEKR